jgi:hypothetical protein
MRFPHRLIACVALVIAAGCTSSPQPGAAADTRQPTSTNHISAAVTSTVTTGRATGSVVVRDAKFMCGPTDGAWISATIESTDAVRLFGQVWLEGKPYGRSDDVSVPAAGMSSIGFAPDTPMNSYGHAATLRIMRSDDPTTVMAEVPVLLHLPVGAGMCG